jgi:protein SCO1/2
MKSICPPSPLSLLAIFAIVALCVPTRADERRTDLLRQAGIDQKLGSQIPPNLVFRDESGREVRLGEYFRRDRPIVLALVYYGCPTLCTTVLNELNGSMRSMPRDYSVGEQFDLITVSFDPNETPMLAAKKKAEYVKACGRPRAQEGWHFLTGDQPSIEALTHAVGFRYVKDPQFPGQYVHASGLMVLTPSGVVSRYFYGINYASRDLRLALTDASEGRRGNLERAVLLFCFHYDPATGKYTLAILNLLKLGAGVTLAVIAFFYVRMWRRSRRAAADTAGAGASHGLVV